MANSLGVGFEVLVLLWLLRKRWHSVNENKLAATVVKGLAASMVMAGAIVIIEAGWNALGLNNRGFVFNVGQVAVEAVAGVLVFGGTAFLLRMEELGSIMEIVTRRRKKVAFDTEAAA